MNLLEFAVQRKLDHEDQLLDYVAKNQDVPVDVLSTSLSDVIGPLEDRRATLLVGNYAEMLSEYVPMTYKRDVQTGEYTVEGEIDERILDSIRLVHNIDAESAISQMVEENIQVLTNSPAEVQGLDLSELEHVAMRLESQTIETLSDDVVAEAVVDEAAVEAVTEETIQEATAVETITDEAIAEAVAEEMSFPEEPIFESVPEIPVEEPVAETIPEEVAIPEEPVAQVIPEEPVVQAVAEEEPVAQVVEEEVAVADEPVAEAVAEEQAYEAELTEEEEQQIIAEKMKRIYLRLVEDIKELGLDKSLGLAL